jgi:hypothetical protein
VAPAQGPTALAQNFMFIIGGLLKMSQNVTVSYFPLLKCVTISIIQKSEGELDLILRLTFACFQKGGLLYSRVGAEAGATEAGAA